MEAKENPQPALFALGANHLTASVALRDRLLISEADLPPFSRAMLQLPGMRPALL